MLAAHRKHKGMVMRQSSTLADAVKEYQRRYGRAPPRGFDKWFEFVKANGVKIVDEYDSMVKDLEPFWALDGVEMRRRAEQVGELASIDLVFIKNGNATLVNVERGNNRTEVSARAQGFARMIEKFQHTLPDMVFAVNARAEARVLVPWAHIVYPNSTNQNSAVGLGNMLGAAGGLDSNSHLVPDWRGQSSVWEAFRQTCPPGTEARRIFRSLQGHGSAQSAFSRAKGQAIITTTPTSSGNIHDEVDPYQGADSDFQFVEETQVGYDYCAHPEAHTQSGHFFSDWRTIPALYPVLSPAKAPGFSDLIIPSHYYYSSTKRYTYGYDAVNTVVKDIDDMEIPWERKEDNIFWRGAATGGGSSPPGYMAHYQRHRFVRMASTPSALNKTVVYSHPSKPNEFFPHHVPQAELNSHMLDVAFTKTVGCMHYPGGCAAMRKEMRFADPVPLGEHWRHKYLIDIDGQSYSARFFAFLASQSAVIKSTVYREFYSDWIQPWLHYIPLSGGYDELYNIHGYFSPPSARMVALASKDGSLNAGSATNDTAPPPAIERREKTEGDVLLRKIARAGRSWKQAFGRQVDMEAYVYRLCLEYARLWVNEVAMHPALRRPYVRAATEIDPTSPRPPLRTPSPTHTHSMSEKQSPRLGPGALSRGYCIALGVLALVFLSALAVSRDSIPLHLPKHALTDAHLLRPHDYLNASASDPAPFDFCPIYGPGDDLATKYGATVLARTRFHAGSGARIQRVVHKALSGLPVTISVLGGSVSACHGAGEDPIAPTCYPTRFFNWWNSVFPHPASELTNGALRRTDSAYFAFCSAHHLPDRTDLVILDFDAADPNHRDWADHFELLVRSILVRPDQPAVLVLGHFAPQYQNENGWVGVETLHGNVAQYYDVPHVSTKPLLYNRYLSHPDETTGTYYADPVLANPAGHVVLADVLISYFQSQVCAGWAAARGHAFDAPRFTPDVKGKGLLGGNAAHAGEETEDETNPLRIPRGRMRDKPAAVSSFREVKPFCASANDLVNPLPPSLFYGSGWSMRNDPKADSELLRHYWGSEIPASKMRVSVKLSAGDVGVYFVREKRGTGVAEVACWVDDNVAGGVKISNEGAGGEAVPELMIIDRNVAAGSHFVECALGGEEGSTSATFRILGIFAT
ncbi:glycosyltransferase family 90 protein [Ceratobasidium sp. AG-Ba]|nr:glycosyltransferase family 90 protein [Ceratobasidium sp. AG-Ba]